jgi:hypothetical protein
VRSRILITPKPDQGRTATAAAAIKEAARKAAHVSSSASACTGQSLTVQHDMSAALWLQQLLLTSAAQKSRL